MSDIGELRRASAGARTAYDRANDAAEYARTSQRNWTTAVTRWELTKPQEANLREPRPLGGAHYDIAQPAPPTDKEVADLVKAAGKASRKLDKATKALNDAAALGPPRREPSPTGWSAVKSFRFLGEAYDPGDPFDPGVAEPGKLARLVGLRMVAPTSPAGADPHGS